LVRGRVARHLELGRIGTAHGKSASQVALRWLIEQDGVAPIPKASSEGHARANFDIFDFALSEDDRRAIDALASRA
jgi:2,5-diketo-D-gluconate reductase B